MSKETDKNIDEAFNVIVYALIGLCFIGSGVFIIKSFGYANYLYHSAGLMAMGIALSLFIFYIKSWSDR